MIMRNALGLLCQRGCLLALCEGAGLYESDVTRAQDEVRERNRESAGEETGAETERPSLAKLAANLEAERQARWAPVNQGVVNREFDLLRAQWSPEGWRTALRVNGLSPRSWRCALSENDQARSWIEQEIKVGLSVAPEEYAVYYAAHEAAFAEPLRLRARHIFFAAPAGSAPELVEEKRAAAQAVLDRLRKGEKFDDLVASSEDEASRKLGGDLNFFAEARMPSDFWEQIVTRHVGQPAELIRTQLGFHVVQVMDVRPGGQMCLEEASPDILSRLENEKRVRLVSQLREKLLGMVRFFPGAR